MKIAFILRVKEFRFAFIAGGNIRGHEDGTSLLGAFNNLEVGVGFSLVKFLTGQLQDGGPLGRFLLDGGEKLVNRCFTSLGEDLHVRPLVADTAADMKTGGQSRHKGTEAHTLYDAEDFALIKCHGCHSPSFEITFYYILRGLRHANMVI